MDNNTQKSTVFIAIELANGEQVNIPVESIQLLFKKLEIEDIDKFKPFTNKLQSELVNLITEETNGEAFKTMYKYLNAYYEFARDLDSRKK